MASIKISTQAELDELIGKYEIVKGSYDHDFFWVSLWWDTTIDSPKFLTAKEANDWAVEQGGTNRRGWNRSVVYQEG